MVYTQSHNVLSLVPRPFCVCVCVCVGLGGGVKRPGPETTLVSCGQAGAPCQPHAQPGSRKTPEVTLMSYVIVLKYLKE